MAAPEQNRLEEERAMERERLAFERRQAALQKIRAQFYPAGNGAPDDKFLIELDQAEAEFRDAVAEVDRITAEIRAGRR